MAKQKIEIEVDIPDGYEFIRYGVPIAGEFVIYPDDAVMRSSGVSFGSYIIVREAWKWPPWLKADYIAMDKEGDWYAHRDRPIRYERFWVTEDNLHLAIGILDFTPPPCDDWTQSLRVRPGVEQKETAK